MLTNDPTVNKILDTFIKRSDDGMKRFGQSIRDNNKKTIVEWITDAQEEAQDNIVYLEKLKELLIELGLGDYKGG